MSKPSFYLDTNVISHLADPERTDQEVRRRLALLVRSGAIEVIGAAEIVGEFAGLARTNAELFSRSLGLFWTLVGDKVLVGRKKLVVQEIKKGNRLSRAEALLDVSTVRRLHALPLDDVNGWDEIARGVRGQGEEFTFGMQESAEKVQDLMLVTVTAREVRKNAGQYEVHEKTVKDWVHVILKSNRRTLSLSDEEAKWPDVGQLPCMRAFVSIVAALTKKHHMARDHKYRVSDQPDVDHYTSAAMAGCLVTSDQALRDTASLITWRSFPVIDRQKFLAQVRRL